MIGRVFIAFPQILNSDIRRVADDDIESGEIAVIVQHLGKLEPPLEGVGVNRSLLVVKALLQGIHLALDLLPLCSLFRRGHEQRELVEKVLLLPQLGQILVGRCPELLQVVLQVIYELPEGSTSWPSSGWRA